VYHRPDVILMDAIMPGLDGVLATRKIVKLLPDQLVVVLTSAGEEELGLLALQAGAVGFLSKDCDIEALPRALEAVRSGEAAISRAMTRRLIERVPQGRTWTLRPATRQGSADIPRVGDHRSPRARPVARSGRQRARPLHGDRALPHQEHHAQAQRSLAR